MNGRTKVPSRLTNVPANSTHAAGGSARRFSRSVGRGPPIPFSVRSGSDVPLSLVIGDVAGRRDAVREVWVGLGFARDRTDRQDAGPDGQVHVLLVVLRRPGPDLRRGLLDRDREEGGLIELALVGQARVVGATVRDVVHERALRGELLVGVGHLP